MRQASDGQELEQYAMEEQRGGEERRESGGVHGAAASESMEMSLLPA